MGENARPRYYHRHLCVIRPSQPTAVQMCNYIGIIYVLYTFHIQNDATRLYYNAMSILL